MWLLDIPAIIPTFLSVYQRVFASHRIPDCRALPQDTAWPNATAFDAFNKSISGRLIKTVPIGSPCHSPTYDAEECGYLQDHWRHPEIHLTSSSSVMNSIFLNKSCDPFTDPEEQCITGAYVQYAVNVSEPQHVVQTLEFVKKYNIRFVVKNTGHDYMGKSTGTGAISVWMHHLQNITFIENFTSKRYSGPAFRVQAGVQGFQITHEASRKGLVVVSGSCPNVGFAGGYIQGGGHSSLSSMYGLGADQTLSFEVITPQGKFVTASPEQHNDLYWALSGGGGGTYGIVWSVTVKAHPDLPITVALLSFSAGGTSKKNYWKAISAFQADTPHFIAARASAFITFSASGFNLTPLFAVNSSVEQVKELLNPFMMTLDSLGIKSLSSIQSYPTYAEAFGSVPSFQTENQDIANFQLGNRLLPRYLWDNNVSLSRLMGVLNDIVDGGGTILDVMVSPTLQIAGYPNNAVLPAWRNAFHAVTAILPLYNNQSIESIAQDQQKIAYNFTEALHKITQDSGAYLNEASPIDPYFKQVFYGDNYNLLLTIKDKYDPDQVMYGSTAIGGDRWREMKDGRLCRTRTRASMKSREDL
ncbi:hypothetical protein GYMLUDRAFT_1000244 [Collybiopsis luxurians FD-317 M1]|uniref:FAD-binding PCMH-type domain-containing protein n=1 Tax=Collybiopsis luxurians FD-317 M1 TaxID=944289 RepID=A0A0D0BX54_9AGAR|nr:hypothetical protein GYMLUDRAFT_1000244 [Collybiopsis luxurians FD-317 M1]